jgi:hypothetical protein
MWMGDIFTASGTARSATQWLLANTIVSDAFTDTRADVILITLLDRYVPRVPRDFYNPLTFLNPTFSRFVLLRESLTEALDRLCTAGEVIWWVTGEGALAFRSETAEEKLRRATIFAHVLELSKTKR